MAEPEARDGLAPVEVLRAEDNPADVRIIREALTISRIPHRLHVVEDGEQALDFALGLVRRRTA
jgi:CheY-like chemotaxis protein